MTNLLRVTAVWGAVVPSFPQSSRRLAGPTFRVQAARPLG